MHIRNLYSKWPRERILFGKKTPAFYRYLGWLHTHSTGTWNKLMIVFDFAKVEFTKKKGIPGFRLTK